MSKVFVCLFIALNAAFATANKTITDTAKVKHVSAVHGKAVKSSTKTTAALPVNKVPASTGNFKLYHSYSREIDLYAAPNKVFNIPGNTLFDALMKGMKQQKIKIYSELATPATVTDEPFTQPITYKQLLDKINDVVFVDKFDKEGNLAGTKKVVSPFSQDNLVGYRIKEVVYLNKQTGKAETQIIGIAPLRIIRLTNGDVIGSQPICWLKFKQCLPVLAAVRLSDTAQNISNISLSDIFINRRFTAKITEESNPQGLRIRDYKASPKEQDIESARIEKSLADFKANPTKY
jgi:hypothetical protein